MARTPTVTRDQVPEKYREAFDHEVAVGRGASGRLGSLGEIPWPEPPGTAPTGPGWPGVVTCQGATMPGGPGGTGLR